MYDSWSKRKLKLMLRLCRQYSCDQLLRKNIFKKQTHISYIEYLFQKIKYDNQIKRLNLGPGSDEC